jgi:hypothetical protein
MYLLLAALYLLAHSLNALPMLVVVGWGRVRGRA